MNCIECLKTSDILKEDFNGYEILAVRHNIGIFIFDDNMFLEERDQFEVPIS